MINVSKNAQKHFSFLLSKEPIDTHIRFFIINPGTQNAECGVSYCLKNEIEKSDIQLQYNQFFIYVNKSILSYLKNAEIDLVIDKIGSYLTVTAPYSKCNIITEKSSLEEKIENFLMLEINPQLSAHGGRVNLVKIDSYGTAIIKFSGGCNGCAMIGLTLKQTVEKKLLSNFIEIKKVCDETDHLHGNHSFY